MANSSGRPNPWLTLGKLFGALLATGVLAAGLVLPYVGGLGLAAKNESDKFLNTSCNLNLDDSPPEPTTIYAKDGKTELARLFVQDRQPVTYAQIPTFVQKALIDTEDRRFYEHHGVDMRGLIRSAFSTSNGDTQGGSTLTMQYVKQVRYYKDIGNLAAQTADIEQTLARKLEDAQCAIKLEKSESKQQILTNYLNIAFFGENSYSIESAAQTYFNESINQLTVPQAAMLVGLLQAPSSYDPFVDRDAATARRNVVLQNMVTAGDLTQAQANKYAAQPIRLATTSAPTVPQGCANAKTTVANSGFFCDYVVNWLTNVDGISSNTLDTGGLSIITTLDPSVQNSTQSQLLKSMPSTAQMTAVLPVVDPKTGDILAMASNKLYGNATSAKDTTHTMIPIFSQPIAFGASTYKLFSLLTALQTGFPSSLSINTYGSSGQTTHEYTPQNCLGGTPVPNANEPGIDYTTNETLASGTAKSSNTFFVALDDEVFGCQLGPIVSLAEQLGLTNLSALNPPPTGNGKTTVGQDIVTNGSVIQLVEGSGMQTSPLAITGAYAAVANGGAYNLPAPVLSIKDGAGNPLPVKRTPQVQVLQPQVAAQAAAILTGDTLPGGTSATVFAPWNAANISRVAGKTGTAVAAPKTTDNSSLWFAGITPNLAATMAIINPAAPSNPIPSLPFVKTSAQAAQTYGDYASQVWLNSLEPTLQSPQFAGWSWPDPASMAGVPNMVSVPNLTNLTVADAKTQLASLGLKLAPLAANGTAVYCASPVPTAGNIAYYGPQLAAPGSTVTICPASGSNVYVPPPPPPKPTPTPTPTNHASSPAGGHSTAPATHTSPATHSNPVPSPTHHTRHPG